MFSIKPTYVLVFNADIKEQGSYSVHKYLLIVLCNSDRTNKLCVRQLSHYIENQCWAEIYFNQAKESMLIFALLQVIKFVDYKGPV